MNTSTSEPSEIEVASGNHGSTATAAGIGAGVNYGQALLAAAMIGLGVRGLYYGDFAGVWQRIPIEHLAGQDSLAYLAAALELATGIGLLAKRTVAPASAVLVLFLLLWAVLLKLPAIIAAPQMEASWLGFGEIGVILAGGWAVFAANAGDRAQRRLQFATGRSGVRGARIVFAISLPMIGLSHFVYAEATVGFIPAWLPWHYGWAYLTGAANIAAAVAVLFGIWPRLAATLEAAMLSAITLLVWLPGVVAAPGNPSWTPFLMSSAIACGAWAVAGSYRAAGVGVSEAHGEPALTPTP